MAPARRDVTRRMPVASDGIPVEAESPFLYSSQHSGHRHSRTFAVPRRARVSRQPNCALMSV